MKSLWELAREDGVTVNIDVVWHPAFASKLASTGFTTGLKGLRHRGPLAFGSLMKSKTIRRWSFVHTWTSLICTVFLLMLAITGLPLIFHHEIEHLLGDAPEFREMPADTPHLDLQQLVEKAKAHRPGEVVQYFGWDEDEPNGIFTIMAPTPDTEPNSSHTFMLDARTGEALEMPSANGGFMMVMLRLHVDMFAGLPGKLLLAFMGLLFVIAIVSGVVLYLPFMRRLKFATVRQDKSKIGRAHV